MTDVINNIVNKKKVGIFQCMRSGLILEIKKIC